MTAKAIWARGMLCLVAGMTLMPMRVTAQAYPDDFCSRPEVLELAQRHYSRQAAHLQIVENTATELRVTRGTVVCGITVRVITTDAPDSELPRTFELQPRYFQLQVLDGGLRLDFGERSGPMALGMSQP